MGGGAHKAGSPAARSPMVARSTAERLPAIVTWMVVGSPVVGMLRGMRLVTGRTREGRVVEFGEKSGVKNMLKGRLVIKFGFVLD